jgi:hypothetical protein
MRFLTVSSCYDSSQFLSLCLFGLQESSLLDHFQLPVKQYFPEGPLGQEKGEEVHLLAKNNPPAKVDMRPLQESKPLQNESINRHPNSRR